MQSHTTKFIIYKLNIHGKNLFPWPPPSLKTSVSTSQLVNSEVSENFHFQSCEYHKEGVFIWILLANTVNATLLEGTIPLPEQLRPINFGTFILDTARSPALFEFYPKIIHFQSIQCCSLMILMPNLK